MQKFGAKMCYFSVSDIPEHINNNRRMCKGNLKGEIHFQLGNLQSTKRSKKNERVAATRERCK